MLPHTALTPTGSTNVSMRSWRSTWATRGRVMASDTEPTNNIDHNNPKANMFGFLPCPKCGDKCRWPTQPIHSEHPNSIICDGCGFVEKTGKDITDAE
jgi:hypothetical protein